MILLMVSCEKQNTGSDISNISITTKEITGEDLSFYTQEPLTIIYTTDFFWGAKNNRDDNMITNFINVSKLCEEEFGFPVKFRMIDNPSDADNAYALYIESGQSADLIFPGHYISMTPDRYWGDRYIDKGIYMDLNPYLERFCPEAIVNFSRYPDIKDNFTKGGKTYALYAGLPSITSIALMMRKDLLQSTGTDIQSINTVDSLYKFIDDLYQGKEPTFELNKVWVSGGFLIQYAILNSGYYRTDLNADFVFNINDANFNPHLIEDTDIIDYLFNKFADFFSHSYFTTSNDSIVKRLDKKQDMILFSWVPDRTRDFSRHIEDDHDNVFNNYSIVLFNDQKPIVNRSNSFIHIMVPSTSTQPEKALIFMQWLMTDKEVADILTFGSQYMKLNHYRYAIDGTIIPEKKNTIYGFCNLVANFSYKVFLCGNKDFDIIKEYREMTYKAHYPEFLRVVDAQNDYYEQFKKLCISEHILSQWSKRSQFLEKSVDELILNPYSNLTVTSIEQGLYDIVDAVKYRQTFIEAMHEILN